MAFTACWRSKKAAITANMTIVKTKNSPRVIASISRTKTGRTSYLTANFKDDIGRNEATHHHCVTKYDPKWFFHSIFLAEVDVLRATMAPTTPLERSSNLSQTTAGGNRPALISDD
jgi:hypothetical protein